MTKVEFWVHIYIISPRLIRKKPQESKLTLPQKNKSIFVLYIYFLIHKTKKKMNGNKTRIKKKKHCFKLKIYYSFNNKK